MRKNERPASKNSSADSQRWELVLIAVVVFLAVGSVALYYRFVKSPSANSGVLEKEEPSQVAQQSKRGEPGKKTGAPIEPAGNAVYLSSLMPVSTRFHPFIPPPDKQKFGDVVVVDGKVSPHGIFMHPVPQGSASASYSLSGKYGEFRAKVGLNDSSKGPLSPMTFVVSGDAQVLWRSPPVNVPADTFECMLPIKGVKILKLEVEAKADTGGAHGAWIEPHVLP
jgi:hypothetical protein